MEDIDENSEICKKCKGELSKKDKRIGMPICTKCIEEIVGIIKKNVGKEGYKKFSEDVANFTSFISSSSSLMRLDNLVVIQTCFNVFMTMLGTFSKRDLAIKEKILRDSKAFIEIELENIEFEKNEKNDFGNKSDNYDDDEKGEYKGEDILKGLFDRIIGRLDRMEEYGHNIESDTDHNKNNMGDSSLENSDKNIDKEDINIKGGKRIKVD